VINAINMGEGAGEVAEIRYQFFSVNPNGTAGTQLIDPSPLNDIPEAVIRPGELVIVRTQMIDLQRTKTGIFSAYHDLAYKNKDVTDTAERIVYQWGEYNELNFGTLTPLDPNKPLENLSFDVTGGSFTIRYGSGPTEVTNPISPVFFLGSYDQTSTAFNIRAALEEKVGVGNVRVRGLTDVTTSRFGINFAGSLARRDVFNLVIESKNLVGSSIVNISGNSVDPLETSVSAGGRESNLNNDFPSNPPTNPPSTVTGVKYNNGQNGVLRPPVGTSATTSILFLGGFADRSSFFIQERVNPVNVVDTTFRADSVGVIQFDGNVIPEGSGQNLGIAFLGGSAIYLTANAVVPARAELTIADRLTAVRDTFSVQEDAMSTVFNVVNNTSSQGGLDINLQGPLSAVQIVGLGTLSPSIGSISFSGQNVSFTPARNYFGPAVFTYDIRNTQLTTARGTVSINVVPTNDPPEIVGTQFTMEEVSDIPGQQVPLLITPSQVFTPGPNEVNEVPPQTVSFSAVTSGVQTNGAVSLVGGNISFLPNPNFFGTAIFTVTGVDNQNAPNSTTVATITVTVTNVNDAPVPFIGTLTVAEDQSLILIGAGAPTDIRLNSNPGPGEAGIQTVSVDTIPSATTQGGTITTNLATGVVTYRPLANFFGTDTFSYTVRDNASPSLSTTGTVTINITSVNDAPIAVNDTGEAARFVVLGIAAPNALAVMRNDDVGPMEPNDTITIVSVTTPTIGTATVNAAGTAVLFTPPTGSFNTTSTFSYTIRDAAGLASTANVEVFIIPPVLPFALTDSASIPEDSSVSIDVIANDFANVAAIKSLLSFTQPAAGTGSVVRSLTDDRLVYTPPANFFGDAIFIYTMNDDKAESIASTATVTITVTPVNDPPVAADRTFSATEDIVLTVLASTITNGLSKGPGEDAQTLTITNAVNQTAGSGTVSFVSGNIVYSPAADFNGPVVILYTVTDNGRDNTTPNFLTATANLTINVAPVNDAPVGNEVGGADPTVVTAEDTPTTFAIAPLLLNDRPGPLTAVDELPPFQSVSFVALIAPIATPNGGTVTQVGTNFVYAPAPNYNGPDSFSYSITDGSLTSSVTQTLRVTEVNDAPTATLLTREVFASVPTIFNLSAELASMFKGPEESGQTLTITAISTVGTEGTVVLNANGTITFTGMLNGKTVDTFQYTVSDNGKTNGVDDFKTSTGTFSVNVLPFIPSSVRGIAYVDDNNSGTLDPNELRLGGIEISLTIPATASTPSTTIVKQTKTDGSYAFEMLPPGAYTVNYAVPILSIDAPGANTFSRTIVAPGGVNAEYNFSILGMTPSYGNLLENLASNFYLNNGAMRTAGLYAAIGANGRSEWTITRDGYAGDTFQEVVISDDGTRAYLTAVRGAARNVFTASLTRQQFIQVADPSGAKLVRILARSSDLSWQQVSLAAPPVEITSRAKAYLDAVDELFMQEKW